MRISVSEAKGQLTELVRRAKAGDEIILTRHGHPVVRLAQISAPPDAAKRLAVIKAVQEAVAGKATAGPDAARSQDFLYDDDGLFG